MTFVFKNKEVFYKIVEAINDTCYMFWFDDKNNSITLTSQNAINQIREYCHKRHISAKEVE